MERALVLGGGGVAGIAWMAGLLAGLDEQGLSLTDPDLSIGTSAGSVVATWLATGVTPKEMLARQVDPARRPQELGTDVDLASLTTQFVAMLEEGLDVHALRVRIGHMALATPTVPEQARRAVMAQRLPVHVWPDHLVVTVVDALTGERVVLDSTCGFPLVDVVAASCAVPGVWPPVTLGERRYVDGGVHTVLNADLAAGAGRVLVLAPLGLAGDGPLGAGWDTAAPLLTGRTFTVVPDAASAAAFGTNPLDPATRAPAALAGQAQAAALVADLRAFWQD